MVSTVEAWEEKFGGNDKFVASNRIGFDYELNVTYPVSIKTAKIIKNKRDEVVLQLDLVVHDAGRDEVLGSSREWLSLPKQPTDEKLAPETVRKLTFRRRDDLQRLLSQADLNASIYAERISDGGKVVYKDASGKTLDQVALRAREKEVNEYVMAQSDEWHDAIGKTLEDLEGAEFFLVKAPNKKKAQYPYTNIYNVKPETLPMVGETADAPF